MITNQIGFYTFGRECELFQNFWQSDTPIAIQMMTEKSGIFRLSYVFSRTGGVKKLAYPFHRYPFRPFEFSCSCLIHMTWLARLGSAPQLFSTHCSTAALGQLFSFHTSWHLNFPTCLPYCCMYYRPDECHKICGFPNWTLHTWEVVWFKIPKRFLKGTDV